MKGLALGVSLALGVFLATDAGAEEYGPPAELFRKGATAEAVKELPNATSARPRKPAGSALPSMGSLTQKTFMSLGALSLLLLLAAGTYKRFAEKRGITQRQYDIEILARKPVGPKHALLLVSVEGQRFFIGQGTETFTLISEMQDMNSFRQIMGESLEEEVRKAAL